jgi:hypothetical protein
MTIEKKYELVCDLIKLLELIEITENNNNNDKRIKVLERSFDLILKQFKTDETDLLIEYYNTIKSEGIENKSLSKLNLKLENMLSILK